MMKNKGRVEVNRELCKGCYLCIHACKKGVLSIDETPAALGVYPVKASGTACVGCGNCYVVCPDLCITVYCEEAE
ncbi:MAG: 4Fe-4S binding protein [Spirochaetaceae bacterium]|nr:4Fe-4S binding protein [Spirochaetaceae bacterium]